MGYFSDGLTQTYVVDLLGCIACAATLLTFAQKRMWPMRILAITANVFFIGYGAMGLLYPVLLLHLILLPLNVARLIQLVEQDADSRAAGPTLSKQPPVTGGSQKSISFPPFGGGQRSASAGSMSSQSTTPDYLGSAPP
jgi:hypothetical protein